MEHESFGQRFKRILKKIIITVIVLGLLAVAYLYWGTYEKGVMAGKVLRISAKGMVFKTYEGKLNLETFGALKGASPVAESFDFSVEGDETEVIRELEAVALSGERVNLVFVKRYMRVPWRGDTKVFVTAVTRTP